MLREYQQTASVIYNHPSSPKLCQHPMLFFKEVIRESLMFSGGELVLREGYRGGDIMNVVSVKGEKGISRVVWLWRQ